MNNILLTILSVSVSGSVLSLLVFLLKPLIKNRVSKAFSYYIWILALLRLVFPFGYNVSIFEIPQLFADAGVQSYTTTVGDVQVSLIIYRILWGKRGISLTAMRTLPHREIIRQIQGTKTCRLPQICRKPVIGLIYGYW
ncbi:MAG TPA: hypothetical protein GX704_04025 [Clostridiales bacterium]|nr:hypothetical protein [Clostridiales bacterium]